MGMMTPKSNVCLLERRHSDKEVISIVDGIKMLNTKITPYSVTKEPKECLVATEFELCIESVYLQ